MTPTEKLWLKRELAQDQPATAQPCITICWTPSACPPYGCFAAVYIVIQIGVYIVNLWMPLILSSLFARRCRANRQCNLIARYATCPICWRQSSPSSSAAPPTARMSAAGISPDA